MTDSYVRYTPTTQEEENTVNAPEEDEESNLVTYARNELTLAGMFDEDADYGPRLAEHIVGIVREFSEGGHSGMSASITIEILSKLLRFEPLTPLTYEPDEWIAVSEQSGLDVWQNKRKSDVFSTDHGETWYCLDGTTGRR